MPSIISVSNFVTSSIATDQDQPVSPFCLIGCSVFVQGCYFNQFTGDHLLLVEVSDPVETLPRDIQELHDLGFDLDMESML
jgi:hypothetical protein